MNKTAMIDQESLRAASLRECEGRIESAIEAAKEHYATIGAELIRIRDDQLYLAEWNTFEAYCAARWDFSRGHAYRLIAAVKVLADLSPQGDTEPADFPVPALPGNERQARAVGDAAPDPETRREVWSTAQELAGDPQPKPATIAQAAEIVAAGKPINHESKQITDAVEAFARTVKLLARRGQEIQTAIAAKAAVSAPMGSRQVKFGRMVSNMAAQVDILREHIEGLAKSWEGTKRQIDD